MGRMGNTGSMEHNALTSQRGLQMTSQLLNKMVVIKSQAYKTIVEYIIYSPQTNRIPKYS